MKKALAFLALLTTLQVPAFLMPEKAEAWPSGTFSTSCKRWPMLSHCKKPKPVKKGSYYYFQNRSSRNIWFIANGRWYSVSPWSTRKVYVKSYHTHMQVEFDSTVGDGRYVKKRWYGPMHHLGYNTLKNSGHFSYRYGRIYFFPQRGH